MRQDFTVLGRHELATLKNILPTSCGMPSAHGGEGPRAVLPKELAENLMKGHPNG